MSERAPEEDPKATLVIRVNGNYTEATATVSCDSSMSLSTIAEKFEAAAAITQVEAMKGYHVPLH